MTSAALSSDFHVGRELSYAIRTDIQITTTRSPKGSVGLGLKSMKLLPDGSEIGTEFMAIAHMSPGRAREVANALLDIAWAAEADTCPELQEILPLDIDTDRQ